MNTAVQVNSRNRRAGPVDGFVRIAVALVLSISTQACWAAEAQLDSISIMALGPLEARAVIKTPDNKMHVLKLGSVIPGTQATVTQILGDKLVVDDVVDGGQKQTVWITKGGADGKVTVQRLNMDAPAPQLAVHADLVYKAVEPQSGSKDKKKAGK